MQTHPFHTGNYFYRQTHISGSEWRVCLMNVIVFFYEHFFHLVVFIAHVYCIIRELSPFTPRKAQRRTTNFEGDFIPAVITVQQQMVLLVAHEFEQISAVKKLFYFCRRWREVWLLPFSFCYSRGEWRHPALFVFLQTTSNILGWCWSQDAAPVPLQKSVGEMFCTERA